MVFPSDTGLLLAMGAAGLAEPKVEDDGGDEKEAKHNDLDEETNDDDLLANVV